MGFFSSDSESSSSQVTNVKTANVAASQGSVAASENSTVNVLDAGAVAAAFNFADAGSGRAFGFADKAAGQAFNFATGSAGMFSKAAADALETAFKFASDSLGLVGSTVEKTQESSDKTLSAALAQTSAALASKDDAQSGGAQRLLYFGVAALAVFAFIAMRGAR